MTYHFYLIRGLFLSYWVIAFNGFANAQCDAQFDFGDDTVCVGSMVQLTDQSFAPNGVGAWQWVVDGSLLGTANSGQFEAQVEGVVDIELTIQDV